MQDQLHQLQQFFRVTAKKAVIPHPSKAPGQDMLQYESQKVLSGKGAIADLAGVAFRIFESDPAVLIGDDVFFADHAPV